LAPSLAPDSRLRRAFRALAAWPFGVVTAGLVSSLGIYVAFYPNEILKGDGPHRHAFWILIVLAAASSFLRQLATERARLEVEARVNGLLGDLGSNVGQIPRIVRTQPPEDFLGSVADAYRVLAYMVFGIRDDNGKAVPDRAVKAIREILVQLATLAHSYESRRGDLASFSANLMVFVPLPQIGIWRDRLLFASNVNIDKYAGVLALDERCAVTGRDKGPGYQPFALLVPQEPKAPGNKRYVVLPGAPLAFAEGRMEIVYNTAKLAEWAETEGDFLPSQIAEIREYFEKHTVASGFISIPVPSRSPPKPGEKDAPIGIVNIDWQKADLLKGPESGNSFAQAVRPLVALVGVALETLGPPWTLVRPSDPAAP